MRCAVCGSDKLAWDNGLVTCTECGAVVREELIDDSPPYMKSDGELEGHANRSVSTRSMNVLNLRTVRAIKRRALKQGKVLIIDSGGLKLKPYSDYLAEKVVERNPAVAQLYKKLKSEVEGVRSERVLVGLALYIYYLTIGMSKSRALKMAARESYASEKSIANAASRYRLAL